MFEIDHRFMLPPSLRITRRYVSERGSTASVWDLRIAQPNVSHLSMTAIHSLEHFLGSLLPQRSPAIINVAPMGCQTGFYIVTIDMDDFDCLAGHLSEVFSSVQMATEVPLANNRQCGWAENHSLIGAKDVAGWLLSRRAEWRTASSIPIAGEAEGDTPTRRE